MPLLATVFALASSAEVAGASAKPHHHRHHRRRHASTASCTNADTPATVASKAAMRTAVTCLVNLERTSRGLPSLNDNAKLDRSAQGWTNQVVAMGVLTHGANFAARITAVGYIWSTAGENIATGYQTPRQAVTAWMASTDHCRNILDPRFADVGSGVDTKPFGNFGAGTWTQDFGLLMGHRPPSGNTGPQSNCPY